MKSFVGPQDISRRLSTGLLCRSCASFRDPCGVHPVPQQTRVIWLSNGLIKTLLLHCENAQSVII